MIKIFNSAYRDSDVREIPLDEVNIVTQKINCYTGAPYILFCLLYTSDAADEP